MPTYQYQCKNCGYEMEEFQGIREAPLVRCPKCSTDNLVRIIGAGAGLIFKGTGFYLTDYKKASASPPATGAKKAEKDKKSQEPKKPGDPAGAGTPPKK